MDTIRNYLESMFAQLPNTPEVWRAKDELLQMMEDRYHDLLEEGKSENEAVGTVIAEFGNLDEVADTLGIVTFIRNPEAAEDRPEMTLPEAEEMIDSCSVTGLMRGLAVFLFIISPVGYNLADSFFRQAGFTVGGLIFMTVCVVAGIGLLVFSGVLNHKWKEIRHIPYRIDSLTASVIYQQKEDYRVTHALLKTIGIVLIVVSFVPAAIFEALGMPEAVEDGVGGSLWLVLVGAGVMMLIYASGKNSAYEEILKMNDRSTIAGSHVPRSGGEVVYTSKRVETVMSVYWHTVTCLYLIWSFLTFHWWKTWIIWPVAAIIHSLLKSAFGRKEE